MRKTRLLAIAAIIAVITFACKKNADNTPTPSNQQISANDAKQWLTNGGSKEFSTSTTSLAWDKPDVTAYNTGNIIIGVPFKDTLLNGWYKKILFTKKNNIIYAVKLIVEPSKDYLQTHGRTVNINDFTGDVLSVKLDGTFINGIRYVNGKYKANLIPKNTTSTNPLSEPIRIHDLSLPIDGTGEMDGGTFDEVIVYSSSSGHGERTLYPAFDWLGSDGAIYNSGYDFSSGGVIIDTPEANPTLNKLCPGTFNFTQTVPITPDGAGWKTAAVKGLSINMINPRWSGFLSGDVIVSSTFNLEIGVPGFISANEAAAAATIAANAAFAALTKNGFDVFKTMVITGSLPTVFKNTMEKLLQTGLNNSGVRVVTTLTGSVAPTTPVICK
ncbi:hypothetical protein ACI6Q2_18510 [Chitinophagaceae bacterium LWZ2-11]